MSISRQKKPKPVDPHQHWSPLIFNQINDGLILFDQSNKIITINQTASQLLDWEVDDTIGLDLASVISLQPTPNSVYPAGKDPVGIALAAKKTIKTAAYLKLPPPTKQVPVAVTISPIQATTIVGIDQAWLLIIRDQTEEQARNEAKTDFVSTASHEMRTPLATIEGYLALARNDAGQSSPDEIKDYIEQARRATITLSKLFRDLLTASQSEDGQLSNHPSVIDLGQFLPELMATTDFAIEAKGLEFKLILPGDSRADSQKGRVINPAYYIYADPERIRELLTNLIDNSVKYTDSGHISLKLEASQTTIVLTVTDTGIGIAGVHLPHLFRKFYRVDNNQTEGTGLGLFIARKIVELYGGEIRAESQIGQGTQIIVSLTRLDQTQADHLQQSTPEPSLSESDGADQ